MAPHDRDGRLALEAGLHKQHQLARHDVRYSHYPLGVWQRPTSEAW